MRCVYVVGQGVDWLRWQSRKAALAVARTRGATRGRNNAASIDDRFTGVNISVATDVACGQLTICGTVTNERDGTVTVAAVRDSGVVASVFVNRALCWRIFAIAADTSDIP